MPRHLLDIVARPTRRGDGIATETERMMMEIATALVITLQNLDKTVEGLAAEIKKTREERDSEGLL